MCLIKLLIGAAIIVGAIVIEISWLAICFGSVLLGVILLIFAPHILFAPFTIGTALGLALMASCEEQGYFHVRIFYYVSYCWSFNRFHTR